MESGAPKEFPPLDGLKLVLVTFSLSLATFMNVLDTTIANVSIPAISGDLGVSATQGTWVITFFAVSNAIAVPLTGWLTMRIGQIKLFLWSITLFVISSLLCGTSESIGMLITFRVIQGFVAGPMIPLSMSLLLQCYPRAKAGMAIALWSMTITAAPVVGPILGGWITDNYSWPWIFFINVPIGVMAAFITWVIIGKRESEVKKLPVDKVGMLMLFVWVGCLQVMLDKGKDLDWFGSPLIITLAVTSFVVFCYFMVWELTEKHPIIDLTLFKDRTFTLSTVSLSLGYAVFFMNIVLIPLWLQRFMGYTAEWAGLVTAPFGLFAIVLAPVVGKGLSKIDPRLFVTGAFLLFATAFFMRAGFNTQVDAKTIVMTMLVQGLGMAAFMTPLNAMAVSDLPHYRVASASGLMNFARIMLGGFGASIGTTIWEDRAAMHHAYLAEHITPYSEAANIAVHKMASAGMTGMKPYGVINREITRQSFMMSADEIFLVSGVLFLLMIGLVWMTRPNMHRQSSGAASGGH